MFPKGKETQVRDLLPLRPKLPECPHQSLHPEVKSIEYNGSSLGPFRVEGASLLRCECGEVFYTRGESRRWEIMKALELISNDTELAPQHARFLRETMGLSLSEFADALQIDTSTLSRWETKKLPAHADRTLRAFFIASLYLTDSRGLVAARFPMFFIQHVAASRVTLIQKALPKIAPANLATATGSLPSAGHDVESELTRDLQVHERASIDRIQRGDELGFHYFANARQFSGRGLREFLDMAASPEALGAIKHFRRQDPDNTKEE